MVEPQSSKLATRVRFSSPAPISGHRRRFRSPSAPLPPVEAQVDDGPARRQAPCGSNPSTGRHGGRGASRTTNPPCAATSPRTCSAYAGLVGRDEHVTVRDEPVASRSSSRTPDEPALDVAALRPRVREEQVDGGQRSGRDPVGQQRRRRRRSRPGGSARRPISAAASIRATPGTWTSTARTSWAGWPPHTRWPRPRARSPPRGRPARRGRRPRAAPAAPAAADAVRSGTGPSRSRVSAERRPCRPAYVRTRPRSGAAEVPSPGGVMRLHGGVGTPRGRPPIEGVGT